MATSNPYLYGYQPVSRNLYSGNQQVSQDSLLRALSSRPASPVTDVSTTTQPGTTATGPRSGPQLPYDEYGLAANQPAQPTVGGPVPPRAATTATSSSGGGGGGGAPISFEGDPILARIRAMNAQNIAQAEAAALAQRKRAEIGYGYDPNLTYEDPATQEASKQNPFSTLAQLLFGHTGRAGAIDENTNKANLFYSSTRATDVGNEGRQYNLEQAQQQGVLQNLMDQIAQGVLQTRLSAQQQEIQGESDAYTRALQFALANGGIGGGGGGGSDGGGGGATTSTDASPTGYVDPSGNFHTGPPPAGWKPTGKHLSIANNDYPYYAP